MLFHTNPALEPKHRFRNLGGAQKWDRSTIFLHSKRFDHKLSGNVDGRTPAPPEMIEMYLSFTYQLVQDCFKSTVVSIPRSLT